MFALNYFTMKSICNQDQVEGLYDSTYLTQQCENKSALSG